MDKDFKLKNILNGILSEDVHAEPVVKFSMPNKTLVQKAQTSGVSKSPSIYTSTINFSKTNLKKTEDPSFQEYKRHFINYEGKKNKAYIDSRGFPTVGIGHKFESGEPRKSSYTDAEIDKLFKQDLEDAIVIAKRVFPNFDSLPKDVKIKIVSLCFNLGQGGISKFKDFRSAILKNDWKTAAAELKDSRWFKQVGRRARDYVNFFNNLA